MKPSSPLLRGPKNDIITCIPNQLERRCFSHLFSESLHHSVRPFCLPSPILRNWFLLEWYKCSLFEARDWPISQNIFLLLSIAFFFLLLMFWAFSTPVNPLALNCARTQWPLSCLFVFCPISFFWGVPWLHFACLRWEMVCLPTTASSLKVSPFLNHLFVLGGTQHESGQILWSRFSNRHL